MVSSLSNDVLSHFDFTNFFSLRHEVAQDAGMVSYSFGEEGIDRYIVVYKKEFVPSEDELNALRRGEEWNEEKAKQIAEKVCITTHCCNSINFQLSKFTIVTHHSYRENAKKKKSKNTLAKNAIMRNSYPLPIIKLNINT